MPHISVQHKGGLDLDEICMQGVLSKHIARLRTNTARHTDERVRLAGEAIAGSLAVKMLGQSPALLSRC